MRITFKVSARPLNLRSSVFRRTVVALTALVVATMLGALPTCSLAQTNPPAATNQSQTGGQNPSLDENYKIEPDDVISVFVLDVPDATGDFLVRKDGKITVPLAGEVSVEGKTTKEITGLLTALLKKELRNPQVTVNLKQGSVHRIYVMGAIHSPGILDWKPKWRLTEVIAAASGLMDVPERTKVLIFRSGSKHIEIPLKRLLVDGDDSSNIEILTGDVLNFQTDVTVRVQVVGQVLKPGEVDVLQGQGVAEVLAAAGGAQPGASLSGARLVRGGKEIPLDLYASVTKGDPAKDFTVLDGDTLYVPALLIKISVIGMVGKPGPIPVPDGVEVTLTQALALAGGPVSRAKLDSVGVIHTGPDRKLVATKYDLKSLLRGDRGLIDPVLRDGDIVYIAGSGKLSAGDIVSSIALLDFFRGFVFP
jgi:polysaccharide export outer membrane protein